VTLKVRNRLTQAVLPEERIHNSRISRKRTTKQKVNMKLTILDRIEEKYDSGDVTIAPGGWCCNCWTCCNCCWESGGDNNAPLDQAAA